MNTPFHHNALYNLLLGLLLIALNHVVSSFVIRPSQSFLLQQQTAVSSFQRTHKLWMSSTRKKRKPSKVVDEDGPTPEEVQGELEEIKMEDIPGMHYDENVHPIPHQPWRRGETAGCEDPIQAPWRVEAERIMKKAVEMVDGRILDITWYLTAVVVTIDPESLLDAHREFREGGPVIVLEEPHDPIYYDPEDPNPEPIWQDDEEQGILFPTDEASPEDQVDTMTAEERERESERRMWVPKDEDDDPDESHIPGEDDEDVPLYSGETTREDLALRMAEEEAARWDNEEQPLHPDALKIDTGTLSTIAKAILEALETREDDLKVLQRHEVIMASPGPPDLLETQKQFDAYRGANVIVETQDPFESNRVLKGKLLDRNSMDVYINKQGRMVTIPLNFVKCVRLAPSSMRDEHEEEAVMTEEEYE